MVTNKPAGGGQAAPGGWPCCVLVVEDVPQHRRRIARELSERHSGYEVHAVASRDEALAIMATRRPDLVLLDLIIPSGPRRRGEGPGGISGTALRMLERWMELARPASGWRELERVVEEALNRCGGEQIGPGDLRLEELPERYDAVICRGGELERRRASEVEAIALLDEPWPLVLRSEQDEAGGRVVEVVVEGEKRAVRDARLGRVLHLLAFNAGEGRGRVADGCGGLSTGAGPGRLLAACVAAAAAG